MNPLRDEMQKQIYIRARDKVRTQMYNGNPLQKQIYIRSRDNMDIRMYQRVKDHVRRQLNESTT